MRRASLIAPAIVLHLAPRIVAAAANRPGAVAFAFGMVVLAAGIILRGWSFKTLGQYFTFNLMVSSDQPVISAGPYRLLRHPNYLAVAAELLAVPLIGGALATAALASSLNALLLLLVRIPVEEQALGPAWSEAFRTRRPGGGRR